MDNSDVYIHIMNTMHRLLRRLDLNLLVAFDALMQERNVSRAAEVCFLSQPAMSNALGRLREMLDDPILVRTSKGMSPSPRAREMEGPLRSLLAQLEHQLRPPALFDPATTERQFKIALTDYGENLILPKLSERFWRYAPHASLDISRLSQELPETALERGEVDLLIGVQEYTPSAKRLCSRPWIKDRLVCLSSQAGKQQKSISLKEFLARRHIYPSPLGVKTNIVDLWLAEQGASRSIAVTTHSYMVAARLAAETDYLLSLPGQIAQQLMQIFPLQLLKPPKGFPGFQLNLIWHPLYENDPALRWLLLQMDELEDSLTDIES